MSQKLGTKAYGQIHLVRSYMATGCRHICELVGGGYARVDGTPVQSADELTAVIPMPALAQALEWWAHRDEDGPTDVARSVLFLRGAVCYADTGEELASLNEVLNAFPDDSPFRVAALAWWQTKSARQHAAQQAAELALSPDNGLMSPELPVRKRPHQRPPGPETRLGAKPGRRVERLYTDEGATA